MRFQSSATAIAAYLLLGLAGGCGKTEKLAAPEQPVQSVQVFDLENAIWPQDASDIAPDPAVTFGQLPNGMRYIIMANDTPEQTAAMRLSIDAGSLNERDDQSGLSHFLEHMAFNGSTHVPEGEMIKILERHGLAFGPDTNAFTSFDQIQYQLDLPSIAEDVLETGFFLMRETASELTLDPEAIDKERGVIKSEARARNSVGLRNFISAANFLTPDMPLASRLPIGDADVIANAPVERFREIYDAYYRPENAVFVLVGDIDVAAMEARIKETFGDWQGRGAPGPGADFGSVDERRSLEADVYTEPDMTTSVTISYVRKTTKKPDTVAERRQGQIDALGHRILNRRFSSLSRAPDAVFISAGSGSTSTFDVSETVQVSASTTAENWEASLALIEQELRRALEHGFTQAELDEQLANTRTSLENQVDQAGTRHSTSLAGTLASAANDFVFTSPEDSLARFNVYADEITPAMVHEAFKAQWTGGGPFLRLTNNAPIEGAKDKLTATYKASQSVPVTAPEDKVSQSFAYTDFGPAGKIIADTRIEDLNIRILQFENNVRLNLKVTDFEDAIIRIETSIGGGNLEFSDAPDGLLGLFSSNAYVLGGLEAHTIDELQTLLAGRSVSIAFDSGADSFGSSVATTPDDFELQMEILTALITAPAYRPEALGQLHKSFESFYISLDAEPGGIAARDVPRILYSGDKRFGIAPQEELTARTFEELKSVLERPLREGAIEIGIVGDFDEDAAIAIVARTFGALPTRNADPLPFTEARKARFPADRTPITLRHAGLADKALALVYWPTTDDSDQKRTYTQRLLRSIFQLKLTDELREKLGATYSPSANSQNSSVFPGYGYLSAASEVEPGDVDLVFDAINTITLDMAAGDITEDELQRARQPILENIEESIRNNGTWMGIVSTAQTKPDYLDRQRTVAEVYRAITTQDIITAAGQYLKPEAALQIRIISDKVP